MRLVTWGLAEPTWGEDSLPEEPHVPGQRCPLCGLFRARESRAKWRCVNEIYIYWTGYWEHR